MASREVGVEFQEAIEVLDERLKELQTAVKYMKPLETINRKYYRQQGRDMTCVIEWLKGIRDGRLIVVDNPYHGGSDDG